MPKQSPTDFLELPDLDVLRGVLAGDGTITSREMGELKAAIRVVAAIEVDDPAGPACRDCQRPVDVDTIRPWYVPLTCAGCSFWRAMATLSAHEQDNFASVRAQGLHYSIAAWDIGLGPIRTVRFHSGLTVVSGRLMCQGVIPRQYREQLADNAVIFEGDPHGKGIGIFHV